MLYRPPSGPPSLWRAHSSCLRVLLMTSTGKMPREAEADGHELKLHPTLDNCHSRAPIDHKQNDDHYIS